MKKNNLLFLLIFACLLSFSQSQDNNAMKFVQTIAAEDIKKHISILASDEYEGRETGKEGQKKAAQYIAARFKKIGLKSAGDSSYTKGS